MVERINSDEWLEGLFTAYHVRLCVFAREQLRYAGLENLAEDIVQEVMEHAYVEREKLHEHPNIKGWLYKNTHLRCKNAIRTAIVRQKHAAFSVDDENAPQIADINSAIEIEKCLEKSYNYHEATEYMKENSNAKDYEIFDRYYRQKETIEDLSKSYGISIDATKMRISRSKSKMIKILESFFDLVVTIAIFLHV